LLAFAAEEDSSMFGESPFVILVSFNNVFSTFPFDVVSWLGLTVDLSSSCQSGIDIGLIGGFVGNRDLKKGHLESVLSTLL
jgi:hypothetical protein